jgi:kynurenine formamidase
MELTFRVIDLTRTLDGDTALWPGTAPVVIESTESIETDGSFTRRLTLDEHSGTHFDAPSHFSDTGAHVADVPLSRLTGPLHVIDFSEHCRGNADARLSVDVIEMHEALHGGIEPGSIVFLRTDWVGSAHEVLEFPGFGVSAAKELVERGVIGLGIDTLGIDPGSATDFPVHKHVTLPAGVWHVENLINLRDVPPIGSWAVIGVPRIGGASGFPARVMALVPDAAVTPANLGRVQPDDE